jgi:ketosteroid isomerase-like protein
MAISPDQAAVRAMYEAFNELSQDSEVDAYVQAHWDADCEYKAVEESEWIRGRAELAAWTRRWLEAWSDVRVEVDEMQDGRGGLVMSAVTLSARGSGSDAPVRQKFFHVSEVRGGKVSHMREFLSHDEARAAAG